jgi:hypothetical protein
MGAKSSKDLADFDLVVAGAAVRATLDPLDGLFERLDLLPPPAARSDSIRCAASVG